MASGSASYAVSATNYGRNSADSYFILSAPDVVNGSLEITGNLKVDGTTQLVGAVTADSTITAAGAVTAGSVTTAGNVNCAAVTATGAVNSATLAVSGASVLSGDITIVGNAVLSTNPAANGVSIGTSTLPVGVGGLRVAGSTILAGLAAGATTATTLSVGSILAGSLGASSPAGYNPQPGSQYTMVIAGWRITWGVSPQANGSGTTSAVSFSPPFAVGVPMIQCSPLTGGAVGYFVAINPTNSSVVFQGTNNQAGGLSLPCMYLAIGPA